VCENAFLDYYYYVLYLLSAFKELSRYKEKDCRDRKREEEREMHETADEEREG
jgi:hypothetical protein